MRKLWPRSLTDQPDDCSEKSGQQRDDLTRCCSCCCRFLLYPLLLNLTFSDLDAYLCNKSVHVHSFGLSKAINPEDGLHIMRRVPRHVKHNHPIGCHKIDPQAPGLGRDEKQTGAERNQKQVRGYILGLPYFNRGFLHTFLVIVISWRKSTYCLLQ